MEQITPEIVETLAVARLALRRMGTKPMDRPSALYAHYAHELVNAFAALDDAGAFAALDEAVQSAMAESILAESARDDVRKAREALVAEGVTTGYVPALERVGRLEYPTAIPELDEPETAGQEARRMSGADEWAARARAADND